MVFSSARTLLSRFGQNRSGNAVERWAIIAGAIAIGSVGSAHLLDIAQRNGALPSILVGRSNDDLVRMARNLPRGGAGQSVPGNVDMTATASIATHAGAVLIDPCTGKPR